MNDSIANPPEKDPKSIMTVADQGQGGLEEKIIIITETLIVNMLLCGHSIAGEIFGCKGQVLWSGESTTSLNHVRHL